MNDDRRCSKCLDLGYFVDLFGAHWCPNCHPKEAEREQEQAVNKIQYPERYNTP